MAIIPAPFWRVTFVFGDNNGKTAACGVAYPASLAYADVATSAGNLAADLDAISDAVLLNYQISTQFVEDAPAAAPATSEVERKLLIPLGTSLTPNATSIEVPSPVFGIEVNGTDVVDSTNPLVDALLDELTRGLLTPGNGPVTYYGADITRAGTPTIVHRTRRARQ